jgi:hypothetical protein
LPSLLVLEEETQIKVPISVVATQREVGTMGSTMVFPMTKSSCVFEGCVAIILMREGHGFVVTGDEVCTPMEHISDWFSELAIANPSFEFVRRNSDQSGARFGPDRCSRQDGKKTRVRINSRFFTIGPDPGPTVSIGLRERA